MPDLRVKFRFVAKVVLATLLLGVLAGVAGSQIVPGWSLARVLLSSALGAAVLVAALIVAASFAERCFVGVEAGTDPGPAPMMTCERHEPDGRLDGRLLRSERTNRTLCLCAHTNPCR